jgi:hypothetical protein
MIPKDQLMLRHEAFRFTVTSASLQIFVLLTMALRSKTLCVRYLPIFIITVPEKPDLRKRF